MATIRALNIAPAFWHDAIIHLILGAAIGAYKPHSTLDPSVITRSFSCRVWHQYEQFHRENQTFASSALKQLRGWGKTVAKQGVSGNHCLVAVGT
ncbi:hypothetical protein [Aliiroseovarius marinus]|uniref:hypothetical protein n=1 Tax=Aliiroseovarius marinus TaxID=2500159 RepID=UPI003D7E7DAD